MATGLLTDLKLPTSFSADVINRATETSAFFSSGIMEDITAYLDVMPSKGTVEMPFWNDLSGDSEVAHGGADLTQNKITQGLDKAAVLSRGKGYGAHDLSAALKGEDPLGVIANLFGDYWAREWDRIIWGEPPHLLVRFTSLPAHRPAPTRGRAAAHRRAPDAGCRQPVAWGTPPCPARRRCR